jgi:hypothetical protein
LAKVEEKVMRRPSTGEVFYLQLIWISHKRWVNSQDSTFGGWTTWRIGNFALVFRILF